MRRALFLGLLLTIGCDGGGGTDAGPDPVDTGTPMPRPDAGPFVCPSPAWDPSGPPPTSDSPRPTELTVDRSVDGATSVAFDPSAVAEDAAHFDLGVQAGAMREGTAILWTHVSDPGAVTLRVWRESDAAGEVMLAVEQPADSADGGFVHSAVSGLAPATRYSYAYFTGSAPAFGGRSPIGSFVTPPPPRMASTIRVAASTCTNQSSAPFEALTRMAAEDPDVFVHVGDILYQDGNTTLPEYRATWAAQLADPGFRDILTATGAYWTWDDHEVTDSGDYYDIPDAQRDIAHDTYFESLAAEPIDRGGQRSLYTSYAWGDAVEFIVMDSRGERDPSSRLTPAARYVSPEQLAFVQARLMNSTARFKVVLNSVPITNLPIPPWALEEDRWQGYAAQREALVSFIVDNAIENVWFLTGDFHLGFVSRLDVDGGARDIWEIAVGPGGSAGGNPIPLLVDNGTLDEEDAFPCGMFAYWSSATNVATTIDFDGGAGTVHVVFTDAASGEALFDEVIYRE